MYEQTTNTAKHTLHCVMRVYIGQLGMPFTQIDTDFFCVVALLISFHCIIIENILYLTLQDSKIRSW